MTCKPIHATYRATGNAGLAILPQHLSQLHAQPLDEQRILSVAGKHLSSVVTLIRHLGNGEIDTSYANQGMARIPLPIGPELGKVRLQLLPDGGCLVYGSVGSLLQYTGFVFRALANGDLDTGFGESGFCILDIGQSTSVIRLCTLSDGKVMAVVSTTNGAPYDYYLARLDNGHLAPLYGENGDGKVYIGKNDANALVILPNDDALVATAPYDYPTTVFKQYAADGMPDSSFGEDGVFEVGLDQGRRLVVLDILRQPDGKIVAVGGADVGFGVHFLITRIEPEGGMDGTFNNGEPKIMVLQGYEAQAVALQPDNKVVVAGSSEQNAASDGDFVLMRFLPNAMLDPDFGDNGQVRTDLGATDTARHVAALADGNILVSGTSGTDEPGSTRALLARYLG